MTLKIQRLLRLEAAEGVVVNEVEDSAEVVVVVEVALWAPNIHKHWKGRAMSIISTDRKLGHVLTGIIVP